MSATLASALCRKQEAAFQLWFALGRLASYLFAHPAIAILVMMAIAGMLWWFVCRYFSKKTRNLLAASLVVLGLLMVSPVPSVIAQTMLVSLIPADSGEEAEAIVVLGRGAAANTTRANAAADLWQNKRAPLILSSGRTDAPIIAGHLIKKAQIPRSVIVQERCSLSTAENAEFTAAMLLPRDRSKIILVTDSLHMLRSLLTFKSFGFEVIPHPVSIPADTGKRRFIEFRESLGAISYGLTGRYFAKEISEETIVEADKLVAQQLKNGAATAIEND